MDTLKAVGFLIMGTVMIVSGLVYFRRADEYARMMFERLIASPPWRRLWMPKHFYSRGMLFWQLRLSGAGVTLIGTFLLVVSLIGIMQRQ
jgi:hypothetical protein